MKECLKEYLKEYLEEWWQITKLIFPMTVFWFFVRPVFLPASRTTEWVVWLVVALWCTIIRVSMILTEEDIL